MNKEISLVFEDQPVRAVVKNGEPWWVALDVCHAIGLTNSRVAVSRLEDDQRDDVSQTDAIGRQQRMTVVNESGLYDLIFRSEKEEAKRFRKWVTKEVLPTLRKAGKYDESLAKYNDEHLALLELDPEVAKMERLLTLTREQAIQRYEQERQAQQLAEIEREQQALIQEIKTVEFKATEASNKADEALANIYGDNDMVAIVGYAKRRGIKLTEAQASRVGGALSRYCRASGLSYGRAAEGNGAHNERWDGVNRYPRDVLDKWVDGVIVVKNMRFENGTLIDNGAPSKHQSYKRFHWR